MKNTADKTKLTCPVCEEGHLQPSTRSETFTHNDVDFSLDNLEISVCDTCGSDLVTPDQFRKNQLRIVDEKRRLDGLLPGYEIVRIRERFNLTQYDAAALFGGGRNAFSKYERGEVIQSTSMDRLLRLIDICPTNLTRLTAIAGIKLKQARTFRTICDYDKPCSALDRGVYADVVMVKSKRKIKEKEKPFPISWKDVG